MRGEHAQRRRGEGRRRGVGGAGRPHLQGQEDPAPLRRRQDLQRRSRAQGRRLLCVIEMARILSSFLFVEQLKREILPDLLETVSHHQGVISISQAPTLLYQMRSC